VNRLGVAIIPRRTKAWNRLKGLAMESTNYRNLTYYVVSLILSVTWYFGLRLPESTRDWLKGPGLHGLSSVELFIFVCLTGIGLSRIYKPILRTKWPLGIKVLVSFVLPLIGVFIFVWSTLVYRLLQSQPSELAWIYKERWSLLSMPLWGLFQLAAAAQVVIPLTVISALVLAVVHHYWSVRRLANPHFHPTAEKRGG
jgi:hypothetical protein